VVVASVSVYAWCLITYHHCQVKLENSLMQIHDLEREMLELKRNNQELQASIEGIRNEKLHLQRKLESALDEKKKNSDRINELTIIGM
jgi:predicted nuclease with TOPRIM domain